MPPIIVLICGFVVVGVLLWIEHKHNPEASAALWIPTIYMLILGSRPLAAWFVGGGDAFARGDFEEGSSIDRWVLIALIVLSTIVIVRKRIPWSAILKDNWGLVLLYLFLGFTILWSDYPFVSLKRWIRLMGIIPAAMVLLGEVSPMKALISVYRRCACTLIPLSLVLVRYYPHLGRGYSRWSGALMWTGVTVTKNTLGQLCAVTILFLIWAFFAERKAYPRRKGFTLLSDGLVLLLALVLLIGPGQSYSATSLGVLLFCAASIFLLYLLKSHVRAVASYLAAITVLAWVVLIFAQTAVPELTSLFGRDQTFTGRTEIWNQAFTVAARHPLLGAGFGAYWGTDKQQEEVFGGGITVNSSHNGLLDAYVETGAVGVIVLLVFLLSFYISVRKQFRYSLDWGVLGICILMASILSNFTEGLFLKSSSYLWSTMVVLIIVSSLPRIFTDEGGRHKAVTI